MAVDNSVVIDTNVWVAASFNPHSASAELLNAVRGGEVTLVWDESTRRETRAVLEQIPPVQWSGVSALFRAENRFTGSTHPDRFAGVADADDRKFAALAAAAGAVLISNDRHLLAGREMLGVTVLTPNEWVHRRRAAKP